MGQTLHLTEYCNEHRTNPVRKIFIYLVTCPTDHRQEPKKNYTLFNCLKSTESVLTRFFFTNKDTIGDGYSDSLLTIMPFSNRYWIIMFTCRFSTYDSRLGCAYNCLLASVVKNIFILYCTSG